MIVSRQGITPCWQLGRRQGWQQLGGQRDLAVLKAERGSEGLSRAGSSSPPLPACCPPAAVELTTQAVLRREIPWDIYRSAR